MHAYTVFLSTQAGRVLDGPVPIESGWSSRSDMPCTMARNGHMAQVARSRIRDKLVDRIETSPGPLTNFAVGRAPCGPCVSIVAFLSVKMGSVASLLLVPSQRNLPTHGD